MRRDADDRERQRPQHRGVEEPGDHEDEEQRAAASISTDARTSSPTKKTSHPGALLAAGLGRAGEQRRTPRRRRPRRGRASTSRSPGPRSPVAGPRRTVDEGERQVAAPTSSIDVASSAPSRLVDAHVGTLLHPDPRRRRCSLPAEQPGLPTVPAHDRDRGHYRPAGASCGAVPSQASSMAWTPGGVKSPILTRTSGRSQRGR